MYGSLAAIFINVSLNYALIFGHFGMPKLGVTGAAIATVIAKLAEVLIVMTWVHTHKEEHPYAVGLYSAFSIPGSLAKQIIIKGSPLLANELMWSIGLSVIAQCYSVRGLDVVAARNIAGTITNLWYPHAAEQLPGTGGGGAVDPGEPCKRLQTAEDGKAGDEGPAGR